MQDTPERSAFAQHMAMNPEHKIGFDDTELSCNMELYYLWLHREAIEIYKHKNNFNSKEERLKIHKFLYPALKICKMKPLITKSSDIETNQSGFLPESWPIIPEQLYACTMVYKTRLRWTSSHIRLLDLGEATRLGSTETPWAQHSWAA